MDTPTAPGPAAFGLGGSLHTGPPCKLSQLHVVCMTDTYIAASTLLSHTGEVGNNPGLAAPAMAGSRRTSSTATITAGVNAEIRTAVGGLPASVVLADSRAGQLRPRTVKS